MYTYTFTLYFSNSVIDILSQLCFCSPTIPHEGLAGPALINIEIIL